MPIIPPQTGCYGNHCIICGGYANHQQLKISTQQSLQKNASRWKLLSMESFSMLFGLPVNHQLVSAMFFRDAEGGNNSEDCKLCSRCFEDVSDVHYIFWQLHNLESKLIQLQNLIFERLRGNYDAAMGNDVQNTFKVLFEEISLNKEVWPKRMYTSRWKEAQECSDKLAHLIIKNSPEVQPETDKVITDSTEIKLEPMELELLETVYFNNLSEPEDEQKGDDDDGDETISFDDNYDDDSDWDMEDEVELKRSKSSKKSSKSKKKTTTKKSSTKVPHPEGGVLRRFLCTADPDICSRTYGRKKDLSKHIKNFHRDRKHVCDFEGCVQKFLSAKTLEWHKIKSHGLERKKEFLCTVDPDICNRQYCTKSDLTEHIKDFHDGRVHACEHDGCKEKFRSTVKLISHQIKVHGYEKKTRPMRICHICGESIHPKHWKEHFRHKHVGRQNNVCVQCTMNFETTEDLEKHEKLHEQFTNTLPYTCVIEDCQTVFTNSLDLKNHVRISHLDWPQCTVCGIRKSSEHRLQIHMKVHQRQKHVFCDQCPKAFVSEPALQSHKQDYHMGIKYCCETCGKEFTLKRSFIRHTRSHSDVDKRFKCSICSKAFPTSQHLRRHETIHSGTKIYACQLCGKRFKQEQNLKQHLNTQQHKGQAVGKVPGRKAFAGGVKLENVQNVA